jgi:hypothetical protein
LIIKSVPMFPEPRMATLVFIWSQCYRCEKLPAIATQTEP